MALALLSQGGKLAAETRYFIKYRFENKNRAIQAELLGWLVFNIFTSLYLAGLYYLEGVVLLWKLWFGVSWNHN